LLFKLIVDDGVLALAIVLWLGLVWGGVAWLSLPGWVNALILSLGLWVLLAESVLRAALRSAGTPSAKPALHSGP
jgi:hypothetical protein